MLSWLTANLGTVLITLLLIAVVAVIIINLCKNKKRSVSPCGGQCACCAMHGACHTADQKKCG